MMRAVAGLTAWALAMVPSATAQERGTPSFLMRAFSSVEDRQRSEDAFYGSVEWREGPRAAVLAAIDSYTTIVIRVDDATRGGLRGTMQTHTTPSDLDLLLRLNNDYIESVQTSDVARFREILADDFLCTLSDGTLIDREAFLKRTAQPSALGNLEAHDVNVRFIGDAAIVHARTTFTLDGAPGSGRYTDVWAKRNGRWVAVAAHVTRK
jgi:ketosteroid isomerase-like protein